MSETLFDHQGKTVAKGRKLDARDDLVDEGMLEEESCFVG